MAKIILSNGEITLVDDCHFDFLDQWAWQASGSRGSSYATRIQNDKQVKLSHVVLELNGIIVPFNMEADHKNRDSLDNQFHNLRVATKSQNRHNTNLQHNNTSGHRGISYNEKMQRWHVRISVNGFRRHIGYFKGIQDAINARQTAEKRYL